MKKIFVMIICIFAMVSCAATKEVSNDVYRASGYGVSRVSRDEAYRSAYHEAMAQISERFNIVTETNSKEVYTSNQKSARANESMSINRTTVSNSRAIASDVVIKRAKIKKCGRKWTCEIEIAVSPDNLVF